MPTNEINIQEDNINLVLKGLYDIIFSAKNHDILYESLLQHLVVALTVSFKERADSYGYSSNFYITKK